MAGHQIGDKVKYSYHEPEHNNCGTVVGLRPSEGEVVIQDKLTGDVLQVGVEFVSTTRRGETVDW